MSNPPGKNVGELTAAELAPGKVHQQYPEAFDASFASTELGIYMISQVMALLHCLPSLFRRDTGLISAWGNFTEFLLKYKFLW